MTLDEFLDGREQSRSIFDVLHKSLATVGVEKIQVTKSQVAFCRKKPFGWAWIPDMYLRGRHAPLVLTLSFAERDSSPRWKSIVQPAKRRFTHHLELFS